MERRDLLKAAAGVFAIGGMAVLDRDLKGGELPQVMHSLDVPIDKYGTSDYSPANQWAAEIVNFAKAVDKHKEAEDYFKGNIGTHIPFATMPMNYYGRCPKWVEDLPVPKIEGLLKSMHEGTDLVGETLKLLWQPMRGYEMVPEFTWDKDLPESCRYIDRVMTPQYVWDVEETKNFNNRNVALIMLRMVRGLHCELAALRANVLDYARGSNQPMRTNAFRHGPVKTYLQRKAFMIELLAWTNVNGYVLTGDHTT